MTIRTNKKRFPLVLVIGIIIWILLYRFAEDPRSYFRTTYDFITLYWIIGIALWALFLTIVGLLDLAKTLFDKNATLTLGEDGILDNLSIWSVGKIYWTDIVAFRMVNALNTNFLVVEVSDSELYINNKNKIHRLILKSFQKRFHSPIVISQKRIDYNIYELMEELQRRKKS